MAQYNFEGDVEGITERQLEFINKVIQEQDFEIKKVNFEPVGKVGDNYAANVKRITLEGENGNMKMIVKIAPSHEVLRMTMNSSILFKNEHIMYTEVLPKLVQLQKDAEVLEQDQLKYAKCYGSFTEEPNEVIILEDLQTANFVMMDRFTSLSDECVKSVLKNFAVYHSLSYVLKKKEPETYDYFKAILQDMWSAVAHVEETKLYFQQLEDNTLMVLDDAEYKNIVRDKVSGVLEMGLKLAKLESNSKYSVIQQGDSWTNNMMFRFEEDSLKESIMIDYQLSKTSNPVTDLLYMIFNCTDHETRSKHYYEWIDYYHSELEKSLSNFGLKANFVYPRDQLDADLKRYGKLLFGLCIVLASVMSLKSEDASKMREAMENPDFTEMTENMSLDYMDKESVSNFKAKVIDLIDSYIQFGLL